MSAEKCAIELQLLLTGWKLENLYETFKDEEIFIEELEMMTVEHLENLLKNHKMGVRIRFEHYFKKWRTAIGAPLEDNKNAQCCNCQLQHNAWDKRPLKSITKTEKETQTELDSIKTTHIASTQTSAESNVVKVVHGAEKIREVLDKINKNNPNYVAITKSKNKVENLIPTLCSTSIKLWTRNESSNAKNSSNIEQPSTTTFHDIAAQQPIYVNPATQPHLLKQQHKKNNLSDKTKLTNFLPSPQNNLVTMKNTSPRVIEKELLPATSSTTFLANKAFERRHSVCSGNSMKTIPDTTLKDDAVGKPFIPKASLKRHSSSSTDPLTVTANDSAQSYLYLLKKYGSEGLQHHRKYKKIAGDSVIDIIIGERYRGFQLLQQYDKNHVFTTQQRQELIQILCEYHYKQKTNFTVETNDILVEQILELFPSEILENYQKGTRGKIYKTYFRLKKQFSSTSDIISLSDSSDPENFIEEQNATEIQNTTV